MDKTTRDLLPEKEGSFEEKLAKIEEVYTTIKDQPITIKMVRTIFETIDRVYFGNRLMPYLATPEKQEILIEDTKTPCETTDAFLEAVMFDDTDSEFTTHLYGFKVALTCISSLPDDTLFYSGGFLTRDKRMFIVLMMLHETLHLLEYKDSLLTKAETSHTVFFYVYAYRLFGIISRLSQSVKPSEIRYTSDQRIDAILKLPDDLDTDGIEPLYDHSHRMQKKKLVLVGYIAYRVSAPGIVVGGKRTTRRRRGRKQWTSSATRTRSLRCA